MSYNRTLWVNDQLPAINAENLNNIEKGIEDAHNFINNLYSVGDLFLSTNSDNPSTKFGGTWELFGKGKTLVCVDETDPDFNVVKKEGGEKTHKLTIDEMPSHNHNLKFKNNASGFGDGYLTTASGYEYLTGNGSIENVGGNQSHNNVQPYITCYIWIRTA